MMAQDDARTEGAEQAWREVEKPASKPRPNRLPPNPTGQQVISFAQREAEALAGRQFFRDLAAAPVLEPKRKKKPAPPPPERRSPEERAARADAAALHAARVEGRREALERVAGALDRHSQALEEDCREADDDRAEVIRQHQWGMSLASLDVARIRQSDAAQLPHPGGRPCFHQTSQQMVDELRTAGAPAMCLEAAMSRVARLARAEVVRLLRAEGYVEAAAVVEGDESAFGDLDESTVYSKARLNQALWRVEGER
jgi:hypothetical protein